MDLTQLANLGEFIGGVAVLVTLIYLAVQVRRSNALEQAEGLRAFMQQWNHAVHDPLLQRDTSAVIRKAGRSFSSLDGDDQLVVHGYWQALTLLGLEAHRLLESGHIDTEVATAVNRVVAGLLMLPGAAEWWRGAQANIPPNYVSYLRRLDAEGIDRLDVALPWFVANNV